MYCAESLFSDLGVKIMVHPSRSESRPIKGSIDDHSLHGSTQPTISSHLSLKNSSQESKSQKLVNGTRLWDTPCGAGLVTTRRRTRHPRVSSSPRRFEL